MARRAPSSDRAPENPATVIRVAFAVEAFFTLVGGIVMVIYPEQLLAWAKPKTSLMHNLTDPRTWAPAPQAAILLQWLGALLLAIVTPLVAGIQNGPGAVFNRQQAYKSILIGETAVIGAMVWQLLTSAEISRAVTDKALIVSAGVLAAPIVWRLYCLLLNPSIFGAALPLDAEKRA